MIRQYPVPVLAVLAAFAAWPLMATLDPFEALYDVTRAHEHRVLGAAAILILNAMIALLCISLHQWHRLNAQRSEQERMREAAEKSARHDPLTGLLNRRAFALHVRSQMASGADASDRVIAMIDLDRFKPINDLHGHATGDATLQAVAARLGAELAEDGVLARLGGDEFAVLYNAGIDAARVERISRRILHAMEAPISACGRHIMTGCSIGLVPWRTDTDSSEALRRADKALFLSKTHGRGRFTWYDAALDRQSRERAATEAELREAIARNDIKPFFQPIVEFDTGKLTGFEILARWTHASLGQVSPSIFIGIAEDSGQIGRLGFNLLRQACDSARHWDSHLSLSFNLSPCQFDDDCLVGKISTVLTECGFDPGRLTIEITESSIIHDLDMAREKLDGLKALGIKLALDDFGTGYSSLASLRKLPFDRIKIDRSFVTDIAHHPQNQKIVTGIMALAKGLDLDVTAEGIESRTDFDFLHGLDCSLGQGYLFEKAVPADQVSWLLETRWSDRHIAPAAPSAPAAAEQREAG